MGFFDDYLEAAPRAKRMRGNGITNFLLRVFPIYHFQSTKKVTATIIAEALLKLLYSRLGLKVIKYFATSPHFEMARKQFNYESGKSNALQKKTIGLQCYPTIPRCVTIFYSNRIDLNEIKIFQRFK